MKYKNKSRGCALCPVVFILILQSCTLELPGESVGTFQVTGTLTENACGPAAVPALNTIEFPVDIRNRKGEAIWRRPQAPLASGTTDGKGNYHFDFSTSVVVSWGVPQIQCHLDQKETISVHIEGPETTAADAGTESDGGINAQQTLEGNHTIDLIPVNALNCPGALAIEGGPFLALPCRLEYDLNGTTRKPF